MLQNEALACVVLGAEVSSEVTRFLSPAGLYWSSLLSTSDGCSFQTMGCLPNSSTPHPFLCIPQECEQDFCENLGLKKWRYSIEQNSELPLTVAICKTPRPKPGLKFYAWIFSKTNCWPAFPLWSPDLPPKSLCPTSVNTSPTQPQV